MSQRDDERLLAHVRPDAWKNPDPLPSYDFVVIGGGTAGLVCAAGAAALGARVALVERTRLGGECLNTGCVPSKALLRSARVVAEARAGAAVGVNANATIDFDAVMSRLPARQAALAPNDSASRLASRGVHVFFGAAHFEGPREVRVGDALLRFRKAVLATGSRPAQPAIEGLSDIPYLTNETVFSLTLQPRALAVLGGGAVGCELAQAFALFGTNVTLIERAPDILPSEDHEAARIVRASMANDGVRVLTGEAVSSMRRYGDGVQIAHASGPTVVDAVLIATGRAPLADGLDLERAGIRHDAEGITVNDFLQTSNPRVYAAGDVCSRVRFTHAADAMARIVVQNALFFGRRRVSALTIPSCIFTRPEVAHIGVTSSDAAAWGARALTVSLDQVDRAVVDDETDGFVRIYHRGGRIVGATIVSPHAGDVIAAVAVAMRAGATLSDMAAIPFPYPTLGLAFKRAGDLYRSEALTPGIARVLRWYFGVKLLPWSHSR